MNINYTIPLFWRCCRNWFSNERYVLLDVEGGQMCIRPQSYDLYILGEVFGEQVYSPHLARVNNPQVVLDLGANIGAFILWAAYHWHPEKVVAVEMDVDNFRLLEQNICLNNLTQKVTSVQVAIWDMNGHVGIQRHAFNHGMNQAYPEPAGGGIPSVTLEKLMDQQGLNHIDFLKMDIEGAEQRLFNLENEPIFRYAVHHLIAELHPTKGTRVSGVVAYLQQLGFNVRVQHQWLRTTLLLEAVKTTASCSEE